MGNRIRGGARREFTQAEDRTCGADKSLALAVRSLRVSLFRLLKPGSLGFMMFDEVIKELKRG